MNKVYHGNGSIMAFVFLLLLGQDEGFMLAWLLACGERSSRVHVRLVKWETFYGIFLEALDSERKLKPMA